MTATVSDAYLREELCGPAGLAHELTDFSDAYFDNCGGHYPLEMRDFVRKSVAACWALYLPNVHPLYCWFGITLTPEASGRKLIVAPIKPTYIATGIFDPSEIESYDFEEAEDMIFALPAGAGYEYARWLVKGVTEGHLIPLRDGYPTWLAALKHQPPPIL